MKSDKSLYVAEEINALTPFLEQHIPGKPASAHVLVGPQRCVAARQLGLGVTNGVVVTSVVVI